MQEQQTPFTNFISSSTLCFATPNSSMGRVATCTEYNLQPTDMYLHVKTIKYQGVYYEKL